MSQNNNIDRKKKFFKDFGIYSIGVLGTRIITFLMVPLYSYFVERPSDYGVWDLCLQICMFLLPVSTLQMREAAFRFLLVAEGEDAKKKIVTFIYKVFFGNLLTISALVLVVSVFTDIQYLWFSFLLLVVQSVHDVVCQISRGLQRNDIYVSCNILNAFLVGILSVVFVAIMKMSVEGIFWANICSRLIIILYVELRLQVFGTLFQFSVDTKEIGKQILRYALPMIPSTMFWMVTTISDRFFISYFVSLEMNGIYAVAIRLTMILHTLALIFYQTWQETAITQYHTDDRDAFFSKVFNLYVYALVFLLICYSFFLKLNYGWLVGANYQQSSQFLFLSGLVFLMGALSSSYFELCYQCAKETKRLLPSVICTAVINLALNFIITPKVGVYGVIITGLISYLFLDVYRYIDTKRYFKLAIDLRSWLLIPVLIVGAILYSFDYGFWIDVASFAALIGLMVVMMPKVISSMILKKIGYVKV